MTQQKNDVRPHELERYLGNSGDVLDALGKTINGISNPVWQALAGLSPITDSDIEEMVDSGEIAHDEADLMRSARETGVILAERIEPLCWSKSGKPNKRQILVAYALCQTACLNDSGGPIGTGDLGTIRQRWYASKSGDAMGFKFAAQALERYLVKSADVVLVGDEREADRARSNGAKNIRFKSEWTKADAQALEDELGRKPRIHTWPKQGWGRSYAQLQSQILTELVRAGLTYEQLWVRDASRKTDSNAPLVQGFHACLLLEKEGLFEHFQNFCRAAGVPVLVAMSGNNAFSSIESILADNFRKWSGELTPTVDNPLHLFTITDHDYAGHVPVQGGAVSQFERYLPSAVVMHRVGVTPEQVRASGRSIAQAGYEFEADYNSAYREWADSEGVWVGDTCYAIEIEALEPSDYIDALIAAIVDALGGDEELRARLAERAEPDWYDIQSSLRHQMYQMSELFKRLEALGDWAGETRADLAESPIDSWVHLEADESGDWAQAIMPTIAKIVGDQRERMTTSDFVEHVKGGGWSSWSPVGSEQANAAAVELFGRDKGLAAIARALLVDDDEIDLMRDLADVFYTLQPHGLDWVD